MGKACMQPFAPSFTEKTSQGGDANEIQPAPNNQEIRGNAFGGNLGTEAIINTEIFNVTLNHVSESSEASEQNLTFTCYEKKNCKTKGGSSVKITNSPSAKLSEGRIQNRLLQQSSYLEIIIQDSDIPKKWKEDGGSFNFNFNASIIASVVSESYTMQGNWVFEGQISKSDSQEQIENMEDEVIISLDNHDSKIKLVLILTGISVVSCYIFGCIVHSFKRSQIEIYPSQDQYKYRPLDLQMFDANQDKDIQLKKALIDLLT